MPPPDDLVRLALRSSSSRCDGGGAVISGEARCTATLAAPTPASPRTHLSEQLEQLGALLLEVRRGELLRGCGGLVCEVEAHLGERRKGRQVAEVLGVSRQAVVPRRRRFFVLARSLWVRLCGQGLGGLARLGRRLEKEAAIASRDSPGQHGVAQDFPRPT